MSAFIVLGLVRCNQLQRTALKSSAFCDEREIKPYSHDLGRWVYINRAAAVVDV